MSTSENRTLAQIWAFIVLMITIGAALVVSILLEPSADPLDIEPPMLLEVCTEFEKDGECKTFSLSKNPAWGVWFAHRISGGRELIVGDIDWGEE